MQANQQTETYLVRASQMIQSVIKSVVIWISSTVIGLLIILLILIATETGTRWLLNTVISEVDNVSIAEINGTLIKHLSIRQLHYQDANHFMVKVSDAQLYWHADELLKGHLHIVKLQVNGIAIDGQPAASEETESSHEILQIPLTISIDQLAIKQLSWINDESKTDLNQIAVSAQLQNNKLTLSRLELDMPDLKVAASSTINIQPDWPLSADLNWTYLLNDTTAYGHLVLTGDMKRLDINSQIKGAVESTQTGFVNLSADSPEFNLLAHWKKLQWPLTGKPQASSLQGEFSIQGTAQSYQTALNAAVSAMNQPTFAITLTGKGNQNSMAIEQLLLKPANGQINLSGDLSWEQIIAFNLSLIANQLNPADFGSDIPGKLDLNAQSKGSIDGEKINIALDIKQLIGVIDGQPLKANGQITLANQQLAIKQFNLIAGRNQLTAQGWLTEQKADLALLIKAPDLKSAWPTLAGSLNGTASVIGSLKSPIIKSNLQGSQLKFADNQIADVILLADYSHGSKKQSKLEFTAHNIQLDGNKIDRIVLTGLGNQRKHQLNLDLVSSLANLSVKFSGGWNGKQWLANISQLDIDHPTLHKWQLQSATSLTLSQGKKGLIIQLPNSCLMQNNTRLCVNANGSSATKLDGELSLSDWPLANSKIWLPEEMDLSGLVSAQATFSNTPKDTTAEANVKISQGFALLSDESENYKIPFSDSSVTLNYQQDQLFSKLYLGLGAEDHITASINANKANKTGARKLSGEIKAHIANMALVDGLVAEIDKLKGLFIADLKLGGTSDKPEIIGVIELQNGKFEIAKLGSTFDNIQIKLNSVTDNPERLFLNAEMTSGKGNLLAQGQLDLNPEQNFPLNIKIIGKKFQISQLPEAEVIISPTLTINTTDKLTKIDGLVYIDKAKIEMQSVPENAIAPSEDEIIIGDNQATKKKPKPTALNTQITIQFGDNTHFSGFGLKTRLTGKLQYISQLAKQRMLGRAEMEDASYRAYGQDLAIRKGEFVFTGPTDNPWLNIEAIRKASKEEITAVLAVTGPLKSPETKIYTEPSLPESEALAYLVTGKSIKSMSQSEGSAVANAAFSYGAGQLSWISDQLGIDEFEFEQSDKIEDSAIRLGQYLTPDLYVGVTMGLFASKYAANLRYRLTEHFSIGTRAGETQRLDLKYHLQSE